MRKTKTNKPSITKPRKKPPNQSNPQHENDQQYTRTLRETSRTRLQEYLVSTDKIRPYEVENHKSLLRTFNCRPRELTRSWGSSQLEGLLKIGGEFGFAGALERLRRGKSPGGDLRFCGFEKRLYFMRTIDILRLDSNLQELWL